MSLNFPANPTLNQVYTVGNESWQWNGHCWEPATTATTYSPVHIGSFPPVSPVKGDLWWNDNTGRMCIYYIDADSSQWVSAFNPPETMVKVSETQVIDALLSSLPEHASIGDAAAAGVPVGGLFKVFGATDASGIRVVASYT